LEGDFEFGDTSASSSRVCFLRAWVFEGLLGFFSFFGPFLFRFLAKSFLLYIFGVLKGALCF